MKTRLLAYLRDVGLLDEVPAEDPGKGRVLARGVCPLHDGADNPNAFLLYADGFVCTTRGCHHTREFGHNLEGLIRLLVHRGTDRVMGWADAWRYARANAAHLRTLVGDRVRAAKGGQSGRKEEVVAWTAEDLAACLAVPDSYFLGRGYRPETLAYFGVGTCVRPLPDGADLTGWRHSRWPPASSPSCASCRTGRGTCPGQSRTSSSTCPPPCWPAVVFGFLNLGPLLHAVKYAGETADGQDQLLDHP